MPRGRGPVVFGQFHSETTRGADGARASGEVRRVRKTAGSLLHGRPVEMAVELSTDTVGFYFFSLRLRVCV